MEEAFIQKNVARIAEESRKELNDVLGNLNKSSTPFSYKVFVPFVQFIHDKFDDPTMALLTLRTVESITLCKSTRIEFGVMLSDTDHKRIVDIVVWPDDDNTSDSVTTLPSPSMATVTDRLPEYSSTVCIDFLKLFSAVYYWCAITHNGRCIEGSILDMDTGRDTIGGIEQFVFATPDGYKVTFSLNLGHLNTIQDIANGGTSYTE